MATPLYILGAGGHGRVVAEAACALGLTVAGILDDAADRSEVFGIPVLGPLSAVSSLPAGCPLVLAIGDNRRRQALAGALRAQGRSFATLVHPSAVVARHVRSIGEGTYVGPLAVVHADATVGSHAIVNTGAVVEHECVVGDFVHVSVNVTLAGGASVGEGALVGSGATVLPQVAVGAWSTVGAGAVVTRPVDPGVVAWGVPARARRREP
ncbi:MAG: acetyltransferase [Vicinamibacteria bacterium]|nr:acetyltransferase [Vicinamibacteria bacterium]